MLTEDTIVFVKRPQEPSGPPVAINRSALPATVNRRLNAPDIDKARPVYAKKIGNGYNLDQIFHLTVGSPQYGAAEQALLTQGYMLVVGR